MTQTLSDLRGLIKPQPTQTKPRHKSAAIERPRAKTETKYSIEAVLTVVPPNARIAARWALTTFPNVFSVVAHKIRPLAIGITEELTLQAEKLSPPLPTDELSKFMSWWCHRGAYLRATAAGGMRVTLSGQPAELLTEQAINHAKQVLVRRAEGKLKAASAV